MTNHSELVVKPCGLSKILENKCITEISDCHYYFYSNKTDFIQSYKLLHAHCLVSNNNVYIPDNEFKFYVDKFIDNNNLISIKNDIQPCILDEAYILYHTYDNVGHTLGLILYGILKYIEGNFKCKVIISKKLIELSNFIKSIIYLFIDINDIVLIDEDINYLIKKCYINDGKYLYHVVNEVSKHTYNEINNTSECIINENNKTNHSNEINLFVNKLKLFDYLIEKQECFKKICLIKMDSENSINKNRHFDESYKLFFINNGFQVIDASKFDVKDLYLLLKNATQVIMSWGCNSWINRLLIERRTHSIILCHKGYKHEYDCIKTNSDLHFSPSCNKTTYIFDLDTSLNENSENILKNIINLSK
jgi:hypothetical protein